MFTVERVGRLPVFHAHTKDRERLALAFLRMQEHYESPKFQGRIFSHAEYRRWYAAEHGTFTYATDWSGFNVPSSTVRKVMYEFSKHSGPEKLLFRALSETDAFEFERFYLIGTRGTSTETLRHEICHGLYFVSSQYRNTARAVVRRYPLEDFRKHLSDMGYHQSVHDDEVQAYAMAYWPSKLRVTREMITFRKELRNSLNPMYSALTAQ